MRVSQVQHKPPRRHSPMGAGSLQQTAGCPSPSSPLLHPPPLHKWLSLNRFYFSNLTPLCSRFGTLACNKPEGKVMLKKGEKCFKIICHPSVTLVQVSNTHTAPSARAHTHTHTHTHTRRHSCMWTHCRGQSTAIHNPSLPCNRHTLDSSFFLVRVSERQQRREKKMPSPSWSRVSL